jgi:hypothetical protein
MLFSPAAVVADTAAFNVLIKDDQNVAHPNWPGAWIPTSGILYVPNRGKLRALPGDYVMVDSTTGWPILVSARAIAAGPWAHS